MGPIGRRGLLAVDPDIGLADIVARQEAELAARQAQLAASHAAVTASIMERLSASSRFEAGIKAAQPGWH
ncbi:hypothetical protein ACIQNU_30245 [Streptomyces sp. NPDC091292]|uniref:hypothetical protein n=1 Tax=Streptomyces sp. NPDC091292 TaxID=3365991 RepID=UPI00382BEEBD